MSSPGLALRQLPGLNDLDHASESGMASPDAPDDQQPFRQVANREPRLSFVQRCWINSITWKSLLR